MKKIVAKIDEIEEGDMKEVSVGDHSALLLKKDGVFYAVGAECTHFEAPLVDGVMNEGRIRCPWHQSCFDCKTGDMEEPPGLDSLPKFVVEVIGKNVVVNVPEEGLIRRTVDMAKYNPENDDRHFVILGGGASGSSAAERLRQIGFEGKITVVTKEEDIPYDRTQLSKYYMEKGKTKAPVLRKRKFYEEHDIEILNNKEAERLEISDKKLIFTDGSSIRYDKLLLATGGVPNELDISGSRLDNIFTLRSARDLIEINELITSGSKVAIIGSGFIGTEAAASLKKRGASVTVISHSEVPFERVLGKEIGRLFKEEHEENGVKMLMNKDVQSFEGDGQVEKVILDDGESIEVDLVLVGIGVSPATGFLEDDLELNSDGSISVDESFQVRDDIYASGDIVRFPYWRNDEDIRIEHWRLAQQHGRIAAENMVDEASRYFEIPVFWTNQFDINMRYVGHVGDWDSVLIDGDLSQKEFIAYYFSDSEVKAAAGVGKDRDMAAIAELLRTDKMPDKIEPGFDPVEFLESSK